MSRFDSASQLMQRTRRTAKLVFDTAARQHTAGSRGHEATSRHLLFEVEDLCLDLRLDAAPTSDLKVVVGQLADRMDPLKPLAGLPVLLIAGGTCLAQTVSNRLGEFQVEFEPSNDDMRICLPLGETQLIEVPMNP